MTTLPGTPTSYWLDSTPRTDFAPLSGEHMADVCVVGGGICGLTTALLLARAGRSVVVVEADRVVEGVTGYTTAKVTSQHNLVYDHLRRHFGDSGARTYADANQAGLAFIAGLVEQEGIDCDFSRQHNVVYTEAADEVSTFEAELAALQAAGLPAELVTETSLPFPVAAALRVADQAQFHPRKYLLHLTRLITDAGGVIVEQSRVVDVDEGSPSVVRTEGGAVRANHVVVTTHLPILDRGLFFAKCHPFRDYVLAAPIEAARAPKGMFISTESPTHSIRTTPHEGGLLLIVGGEGHKTGQEPDTEERYRCLADWVTARFGVSDFRYRWSTQDNASADRVPYIGRLRRTSGHLWTATGFSGWGMTGGTVAGLLLADLVQAIDNPWRDLYDPQRINPVASGPTLLKENADVGLRFVSDRLRTMKTGDPNALAPGEAQVMLCGGRRCAAYRDDQGTLHAVSAVCTHLGCVVSWNGAERSWDCPCHGSRFSVDGAVLQGPAVRDLEPVDVPKGSAAP